MIKRMVEAITDKLEDIGFYTLKDSRAENTSATSPMWRCEMLLTSRCNFRCPYCRGERGMSRDVSGDIDFDLATDVLGQWIDGGLKNVRFSGGEPTLYPWLPDLVEQCQDGDVERIAVSTNGSADKDLYDTLLDLGVSDFSISLDSCCATFGNEMTGVKGNEWEKVVSNIRYISGRAYATVGIVVTPDSVDAARDTIIFAHGLGVSDVRVISAAQWNEQLTGLDTLPPYVLNAHPILNYRVRHFSEQRNVRGITADDCHKCHLVKDDSVVAGEWHFPCVIAMREGAEPIGKVGPKMRQERMDWFESHDSFADPICQKNCLDVCIDYNNKAGEFVNTLPLSTARGGHE